MSLIIQDSKNTKIIDGGKVMLTDANGKEIIVNVKDINDASTYGSTDLSNIQNEYKSTVSITCEITDEAGEIVDIRTHINLDGTMEFEIMGSSPYHDYPDSHIGQLFEYRNNKKAYHLDSQKIQW